MADMTVSDATCKVLGSCHSALTKKEKAEQSEKSTTTRFGSKREGEDTGQSAIARETDRQTRVVVIYRSKNR